MALWFQPRSAPFWAKLGQKNHPVHPQKNPKKTYGIRLKARGSSHGNHPVRPPYGTNSRGFVAQQAPTGAIHPHPIRLGNFDGRGGNSVREYAPRLGGETHPPGAVPGTGDTVRICTVQL